MNMYADFHAPPGLHGFIRCLADAALLIRPDGVIEVANPPAGLLLGYALDELEGQQFDCLIPPPLRAGHQTHYQAFFATPAARKMGTPTRQTLALRRNGEQFEARVSLSPMENGSVLVTMEDISINKAAEQALARRESLLRLFIEHVPVAVAMLDLEMRYIWVSRRWETDYGLEHDTLIGRSHYEVFPEILESWKQVHARCLAGAVERMEEQCFVRRDGGVMWLRWEVRPWYQSPGEIGGILIFTEDITDRKISESEVALSEKRFRATFEQAAFGMAHVALDGHWIRVNQKLCSMVGYSRSELLAMTFQEITHPDDLQADLSLLSEFLTGSIDQKTIEKRYVRKNGEPIWVALTCSLLQAADGAPDYFIVVISDIDARRRADEELQRLRVDMEQELTTQVAIQTAAAIAHELNQPLNAIASYTEAALRLQAAGDERKDRVAYALKSASEQAQRAGCVIRELMQLLHQPATTTAPMDLNIVVKDAMAIVQASRICPFVVKLDLKPDLGLVMANRLQVEKVIVNLVQNGVEAMKAARVPRKHIEVTANTSSDGGQALISIRDRGPGLSQDMAKTVFQPFLSSKKKGLGMGLAVSRAMIEAQGGKLWLDLNAGPGATFRFTLPLVK